MVRKPALLDWFYMQCGEFHPPLAPKDPTVDAQKTLNSPEAVHAFVGKRTSNY